MGFTANIYKNNIIVDDFENPITILHITMYKENQLSTEEVLELATTYQEYQNLKFQVNSLKRENASLKRKTCRREKMIEYLEKNSHPNSSSEEFQCWCINNNIMNMLKQEMHFDEIIRYFENNIKDGDWGRTRQEWLNTITDTITKLEKNF